MNRYGNSRSDFAITGSLSSEREVANGSNHLVIPPGVPRIVAPENWATGEGIASANVVPCPTLLQKMAAFTPYVGFRPFHPGMADVAGIHGVALNQFPGMAAGKPEVAKQTGPTSNNKDKESVDPSVTIQTVRTQTLAAHNLNSKEPTEKDRIQKIEEWRNDVAKHTRISQVRDEISNTKGREPAQTSQDMGNKQRENNKEQKSSARGVSSQSRSKEGKKESKSGIGGKKGKGKESMDRDERVDSLGEASKLNETKKEKQMEQKREQEQSPHRYDWSLAQQHSNAPPLLTPSMYPMSINPNHFQHQMGGPFAVNVPGRPHAQPDIPGVFPYPIASRTPAFPNYGFGSAYRANISQHQHPPEQIPASSKSVGSAIKDSTVKLFDNADAHLQSKRSNDSVKKEVSSPATSGVQRTSELTEASSRAALVPGQRHYKLVKGPGAASPGGQSGKGKQGETKRVGKGRKPKVKEDKTLSDEVSSTNLKSSSPLLDVATSVSQVTRTVSDSTVNSIDCGQDKLGSRGDSFRRRKAKADPNSEKSTEKRIKVEAEDHQETNKRGGICMEKQVLGSFKSPPHMYLPSQSLSDEHRLMHRMPFVTSAAQAHLYGQIGLAQESAIMPPLGQMEHAQLYRGMFKTPDMQTTIPPLVAISRSKGSVNDMPKQMDGTDFSNLPVSKPLNAPQRPTTLPFVSEEIKSLPGGELLETQTPEEIEARAREFDQHEALRTLASPVRSRHPGSFSVEVPNFPKPSLSSVGGRKIEGSSLQSEHSAFSAKGTKKRAVPKADHHSGKSEAKKVSEIREGESEPSGKRTLSEAKDTSSRSKQHSECVSKGRGPPLCFPSFGSSASTASTALSSSPIRAKKSKPPVENSVSLNPSNSDHASSPVKSKHTGVDVNTSDLMQQFEKLGVSPNRNTCKKGQMTSTASLEIHPAANAVDARSVVSSAAMPVSVVTPNLFVTKAQSMFQDAVQHHFVPPSPWPPLLYGSHSMPPQPPYPELMKQPYYPYAQQQLDLDRKQNDRRPQSVKTGSQQKSEQRTDQQLLSTGGICNESSLNVHSSSHKPIRSNELAVTVSSVPPLISKTSEKGENSSVTWKSSNSGWQHQNSRPEWQSIPSENLSVVNSVRSVKSEDNHDILSMERNAPKEAKQTARSREAPSNGEKQPAISKSSKSMQQHVSTDIQVMNVGQSGEGMLKASLQEKRELEKRLLQSFQESSQQQSLDGQGFYQSNLEQLVSVLPISSNFGVPNKFRDSNSIKELESEILMDKNSSQLMGSNSLFNPTMLNKLKQESPSRYSALADMLPVGSMSVAQTKELSQMLYDGHHWSEQKKIERSDAESSEDEMDDPAHLAELAACSVLNYSDTEQNVEDRLCDKHVNNGAMEYELYEKEELGLPNCGRVHCLLKGFDYYSLMKPYWTRDSNGVDRAISLGLYRQYKTEEGRRVFGNGKSGDMSMDVTTMMSKQEVEVRMSLAELQKQYKSHMVVLSKIRKKTRRHARKMKMALRKDEEQQQKVPIPRKRGRPRKHKLTPVKTYGSSSESQSETEGPSIPFPVAEPAQEVPIVKKRGRGRPPKDPAAPRKHVGKRKNGTKVDRPFNIPSLDKKMSCESHDRLSNVKENNDSKRRHVVRSGMPDTIMKKEEDSDADFSASIASDSTYDAEEDKVAVKSAKAGWRRRRRRVKKTDNTPDFDGHAAPVKKRGRPKAQANDRDITIEMPDSRDECESNDHVNDDVGTEVHSRLTAANVSSTSGLDALSRCAEIALAMSMQAENHEFGASKCKTTVEPVTQPKKRGRKPKNALQGHGVNEGQSVASSVGEVQSKDQVANRLKNEQMFADPMEAVLLADTEASFMDKKKSEAKSNKSQIHQKLSNKDMPGDKARIRKGFGSKSVGESVSVTCSKRTSKMIQKGSTEVVVLDEGEQTRRPPAKRARLFSQEKSEIDDGMLEPGIQTETESQASSYDRSASMPQGKALDSEKKIDQSYWQLSPAVLTLSQRVLVRDLEEPKVYSFATVVDPKPPDLYGVVVDGDRRRKVHWLSQEEIIEKGVLDIQPSQKAGLPRGSRVCARWSALQKCYYPGRILEDVDWTTGQCFVEFDDGDQAWKPLEVVRQIVDSDSESISDHPPSPIEHPTKQSNLKKSESLRHADPVCSSSLSKEHPRNCGRGQIIGQDAPVPDEVSKKQESSTWEVTAATPVPAHYSPISENSDLENTKEPVLNSESRLDVKTKDTLKNSPTPSSLQSSPFVGFDVAYSDISSVGSHHVESENELSDITKLSSSGRFSNINQGEVTLPTPPPSGDYPRSSDPEVSTPVGNSKEWEWCGKGKPNNRKGRGRRIYFKAAKCQDYVLSEGDSAVLKLSCTRGDPYIGLIEKLFEAWGGAKMIKVKWYYRGKDLKLQKPVPEDKAGIYLSMSHVDSVPLEAVVRKCKVLNQTEYKKLESQKNPQKDIYYKKGVYDQTTSCIDPSYA